MLVTQGNLTFFLIFGLVLLIYSVILAVKNEWKILQVVTLVDRATLSCKTIDNVTDVTTAKEKDLVCVSGNSFSKIDLFDRDFGVVAEDSYRLKRKVEMFQWKQETRKSNSTESGLAYVY
jgi:hypothetical protein